MGHDWIFDVLQDMKDYALANGFNGLAAKADEALHIAREEITAQSQRVSREEPDGMTH